MCKDKIKSVLASGVLCISCILIGVTTIQAEELVSTNFSNVVTYTDDLFIDINSNDWFSSGVKVSYEVGLMTGEGNQKFNPKGNLTIAQTIAIASRLNCIYSTGSLTEVNKIESNGKWYDGVVQYALTNGIIKKSDFSSSDMNKPATRGQVAYILSNALPKSELESINPNLEFSDVSGKYADSINLLAKSGVVAGKESGKFSPNDKVTRAEASVIITRLVKPNERVKSTTNSSNNNNTNNSKGRTVYVAPRGETQSVYDKAGSGLTPITVKYGRHTYLSNNQKEYDYVMKAVEETLNFEGKSGKAYKEALDKWNTDAKLKKRIIAYYNRQGIKNEDKIFEMYKIESACTYARTFNGNKATNGINSAYELLTLGKGDCTADAMVNLAVMDALGYNAKVVASTEKNHEWVMVQIDGEWWYMYGAGLQKGGTDNYEYVTVKDTFNNKE